MKFESLSRLFTSPVHEQPVPPVHQNHGHDHIDGDPERCDPGQQAEKQADAPEKFGRNRQDGEECLNVQALGKRGQRLIEPGTAKPAQYFLGAMREKDHA